LIDWERGILAVLHQWLGRNGIAAPDGQIMEAFAKAEHVCEAETPAALYPDVLRNVHGRIARTLGAPSAPADADALAHSIGDWPPFEDTCTALIALKRRYKLVILSNVDRASFARTNQKLGVSFDAIITAEDVNGYKPAPGHFHRAAGLFDSWSIRREEWLHVAQSLYHDHVPAKSMGLRTAWINRRHDKSGAGATPTPQHGVQPDWTVNSLGEFAELVEREFSQ
ncbi:MAG TPA: HAD family hydrolase, partial [Phycisphaerae bacterium]|nr:HAD family hydrolase [Phycisphaerae bacterium]